MFRANVQYLVEIDNYSSAYDPIIAIKDQRLTFCWCPCWILGRYDVPMSRSLHPYG